MQEIEKKYLLKETILSLIKAHELQPHKITQFYTKITPTKGVRYRRLDDHYFKTVKYGKGATREEIEEIISQKKFEKKFEKHINTPIRKDRYMFHHKWKNYTIDVFHKELKGLYILEIEFPTMEAYEAFRLPEILESHVIKDVTEDEAYKNKNITLHGMPRDRYDVSAIFDTLDEISLSQLEHYFIPDLCALDALRVILYKFSRYILFYKEQVLLHALDEDLHQYRVNIRKSRAFLKEFSFLLPQEQYEVYYTKLSEFASLTNRKRDLDVIQERLVELGGDHKEIKNDIISQQELEHQNISEVLKSEAFLHFFEHYRHDLVTEEVLKMHHATQNIENVAKEVLENLHTKIIKKINALEKSFSADKLHKIRIAFKKYRYLLEEFQHIFGEEKITKMIDEGKSLQNMLGDFNDAVNQKDLLHNYFKKNKKRITDVNTLEKTLLEQTEQIQEELLQQVRKNLRQFKKKALHL